METTDYQERAKTLTSEERDIRVVRRITSKGEDSLTVRVGKNYMEFMGHDCVEKAQELAHMLIVITDQPFRLPKIKD